MRNTIITIILILTLWWISIFYFFFQGKENWDIKITPIEDSSESAYEKEKNEIKINNQKNIEFYNTAIQEQNAELCSSIDDTDKKNECHDMIIASLAKKTGNIDSCDTLTSTGNMMICRDIIRSDRAVNSHNKILCMKISDTTKKSYCEDQIDEIALAENTKNSTITKDFCDWLGIKYQQSCASEIREIDESALYTEAIEKNDINLCKKITNVEFRSSCLDTINLKTAINTQNALICDDLIDIEKKGYCHDEISKTNDISIFKSAITNTNLEDCSKIINDNLRNRCNDTVIITTVKSKNDTTLCDNLTNTGMIVSCREIWQ